MKRLPAYIEGVTALLHDALARIPEESIPVPQWRSDPVGIAEHVARRRAEIAADAILAEYIPSPKFRQMAVRDAMIAWAEGLLTPDPDEAEEDAA